MARWEVFPRHRWPRGFGLRELYRSRIAIDGDQLELHELVTAVPIAISALENLRVVFHRCNWSQHDFARLVLGCHERTLQRYLGGEPIPQDRRNWIRQLESVALHRDRVIITVQVGPPIHWLPVWRSRKRAENRGRP